MALLLSLDLYHKTRMLHLTQIGPGQGYRMSRVEPKLGQIDPQVGQILPFSSPF